MCVWIFLNYICLFINSSYLLVFDNDCVMRYMGADDIAGGAGEA